MKLVVCVEIVLRLRQMEHVVVVEKKYLVMDPDPGRGSVRELLESHDTCEIIA